MPMRKPPCKGCELRRLYCHEKCDEYKGYANLLKRDRAAEQEYKESHSAWTLAKSQSYKRCEKYKQKKAEGVVK